MKKYIISIILSLLAATVFAANNTDGLGSLRVGVKDILRSSSDVLDEIKKLDEKYNEVWPSTKEGISSASSAIQKEYHSIKKQIDELIGNIKKDGIDDKSVSSKCKEISQNVSNFKESFEKEFMAKMKDNKKAIEEYEEIMTIKCQNLKSHTDNFVDKVNTIYNDGLSYNLPIGIEADFGSVYVNLQIDKLEFSRGEKEHTKGHAVATLTLPFLPKQEDETKTISMAGDIYFKHNSESVSRLYVNENLRIPIIKDKVYLVVVGEKNTITQKGICKMSTGSSYVEFSCNEITDVNLVGYFDFSGSEEEGGTPSFLIACDKDGNEKEGEYVSAPFVLRGKGGVSSMLCFSHPFKVKGLGDFVFTVEDGAIDFSDLQNPDGFVVPSYWQPPLTVASWIGFYLKTLKVQLPKEFFLNQEGDNERTKFEVSDMYIDDYGFSGNVSVTKLIELGLNKDLGGAGASIGIDEIQAKFLQNEFVGGKIDGKMALPFLSTFEGSTPESEAQTFGGKDMPDEPKMDQEQAYLNKKNEGKKILELDFSADVVYVEKNNGSKVSAEDNGSEPEKHYVFNANVGLQKDHRYRVPFTSVAYVTLKGGTSLAITNDQEQMYGKNSDIPEENRKNMMFTLTMNGELGVTSPKAISRGSSKLGFDLEFKDVQFQGLRFSNVGTPVDIQSIALNGKIGAKLLGLSIAITRLSYDKNSEKNKPQGTITYDGKQFPISMGKLGMDAKVELIGGSGGIGADVSSRFRFITAAHGNEYKDIKWDYDGFEIGTVGLHADYSVFKLDGYLDIFKDDPKFGKGFRGSIDMSIDPIGLSIGAQICFGKTDYNNYNKKYSYWFTRASAEMASTHIMLFPPAVFLSSITGGAYSHMNPNPAGITHIKNLGFYVSDVKNYEPDPTIKFGFIAGIGVYIGSENLAKAKAEMELTFANSMALDQIRISGQISLISPKACKFKIPNFADKLEKYVKEISDKNKILSDLSKFNNLTSTTEGKDAYEFVNVADASSSICGYVNMFYIRQSKKFMIDGGLNADLWGVITGNAYFNFYSEPGKWNLSLGTYDKPNKLEFMDFVKCKSYFEMGHLARTFYPPLCAEAAKEFGYSGGDYSSDKESLKGGKGFAFAIGMQTGLNIEPLKVAYLDLYMYGGTDLIVSERPYRYEEKCRNWRASGDVYGAFGVKLGAMIDVGFYEQKIKIFHGSAFLGLRGEVPSPIYGEGIVKFNASFGEGWFDIDKSYRAEFGENAEDCDRIEDLKNMYNENE